MNQHFTVDAPNGFLLKKESLAIDIQQARLLLRTKAQHRYTSAIRLGEQALLTRHKLICPCCGQSHHPSASHFLPGHPRTPRISRTVIDQWADPQTRFMDGDGSELIFREVSEPKEFLCPSCGQLSHRLDRTDTVQVDVHQQKITLSCPSANFDVLFSTLNSGDEISAPLSLPLTERLTFNLRNGHTTLYLLGADGSLCCARDLAPGSKLWQSSTLYGALKTNPLSRKLLRVFSDLCGAPLPFTKEDATPESFLLMTRFRGYPSRQFFDAIPYEFTSGIMDRSFNNIARELHDAKNLPSLYTNSKLPQTKTIRRLFFYTQGLFFFLREAETLWLIIRDVNLFRTILEMDHIFEILGFLHQCPRATLFFQDYLRVKGKGSFLFWLEHRWRTLANLSTQYASMNAASRKVQRQEWMKTGLASQPHLPYSIPMKTGNRTIRDCTIDGYRFCWLNTQQEYRQAGSKLSNCLKSWEPDGNPVIVVNKGKECQAAIEMDGNMVLQALGPYNDPLELDFRLWKAFNKWLEKYSLVPPIDLHLLEDLDFLI